LSTLYRIKIINATIWQQGQFFGKKVIKSQRTLPNDNALCE